MNVIRERVGSKFIAQLGIYFFQQKKDGSKIITANKRKSHYE